MEKESGDTRDCLFSCYGAVSHREDEFCKIWKDFRRQIQRPVDTGTAEDGMVVACAIG